MSRLKRRFLKKLKAVRKITNSKHVNEYSILAVKTYKDQIREEYVAFLVYQSDIKGVGETEGDALRNLQNLVYEILGGVTKISYLH